jgi:hypothetical protein
MNHAGLGVAVLLVATTMVPTWTEILAILGVAGAALRWLLQRERESGRAESYREESEKTLALRNTEIADLRAEIRELRSVDSTRRGDRV